ncbi:MAG: BrnT family toxin [Rhodospirillaceae bacterium]|nr:BrnT family toxin [Rhodospirillaceae bacterium]
MEIEFDSAKNAANLAKHGVPLTFGRTVLADPRRIDVVDTRFDYGEVRRIAYGVANGRVHVCIYTRRNETYRIISVRKANDRETERYHITGR